MELNFRAIESSERLQALGLKNMQQSDFQDAIHVLNEAIRLNCQDYKSYVYRSYCYERLRKHDAALSDAKCAVTLNNLSYETYFPLGRALVGLGKYGEAEMAFKRALELDTKQEITPNINKELRHVRYNALHTMNFDPVLAFGVAERSESITDAISIITRLQEAPTIRQANLPRAWQNGDSKVRISQSAATSEQFPKLEPPPSYLSKISTVSQVHNEQPVQEVSDLWQKLYITKSVCETRKSSIGDSNAWKVVGQRKSPTSPAPVESVPLPSPQPVSALPLKRENVRATKHSRPTNVFGFHGIWVGGISPKCTQQDIKRVFSKYGKVLSINHLRKEDANCAFINYDNAISPLEAVCELNGKVLKDMCIGNDKPFILRLSPTDQVSWT